MRVKVQYPDKLVKEFIIDKDKVVVGRSEGADICIVEAPISVEQLVFFESNKKFFVQNLDPQKKIYRKSKLLKDDRVVNYFQSTPVMLPGGYTLKVETHEQIKDEILQGLNPIQERIKARLSEVISIDSDDGRERLVVLLKYIVPLACIIFVGYVTLNKNNKEKVVSVHKRTYKKSPKFQKAKVKWLDARAKSSPNRLEEGFIKEAIMRAEKCGLKTRHLCGFVFKIQRSPYEGIIKEKNNSYIVTLNYQTIFLRLQPEFSEKILRKLSKRDALKLYIVEHFLGEKLLKNFKRNATNFMTFLLFEFDNNSIEYLSDILVNIQALPEIDRAELSVLLEEIKQGRQLDRFEQVFKWLN